MSGAAEPLPLALPQRGLILRESRQLWAALAALIVLPFALDAIGLTLITATDVVIFALAVLGLNILVGWTGLTSFGHGAWFGIGAYAVAILQTRLVPGDMALPLLGALAITGVAALAAGALILRRRGVYFSLLTLAFTAMLYAIAFRWTDLTGGENGIGNLHRWAVLQEPGAYYAAVSGIAFAVLVALWRFRRSPMGTVLVAIRENEQRAGFLGYATNRYKLAAFVISATITGLAGALSAYSHRFTSADPISIAFSGELLAMVVIGGMRSFLGPALGALFYILFREFLSIYTADWLLYFGLLFVAFIVFSPDGLVGIAARLLKPFRRVPTEGAAMAARRAGASGRVPARFIAEGRGTGPVLVADAIRKNFGPVNAVRGVSFAVADKTLHALIGPNGAGKTTAFNLLSGMFRPSGGSIRLDGQEIAGLEPHAITRAGLGRSFQITNLFPGLSVEENVRLAVQARHAAHFSPWRDALSIRAIADDTAELLRWTGLAGIERAEAGSLSYGGQRLLDMGLALATQPRVLLLDEPLAGLAAAERERVGELIKALSADIPVLLVEHDIDRVFRLADRVTVMADGAVLVDGSVADARDDARVQAVYLGSGTAAIAAKPRASAAEAETLLAMEGVDTFYGKSHILNGVNLTVNRGEVVALLGRNGAGKSTLLKTLIGTASPAAGRIVLANRDIAGLSPDKIARLGIGYVPQGRALFAGMSVAENLGLGRLRRLTGAGIHWDEEKVLEFFPRLKERWTVDAARLSGGEQQMVAVARALSGDTRLLLLDEPFEGLSPAVTEELFEAFDRLRREIAIILVDHHLDLALALSDRTVALERGSVQWAGESRLLREDQELRRKVLWL
ncbi:ABC-type branched-subunit amino acid transport system ATPase component/ABC-type branched-subunit amino acid transport system permease subunit [Methylobacterium fujisawaense]|uniref:ABC-type branched-subunit amino acid transport system ATPase component/ABC-type branched-subunit amino acid transport system permease subunit n=1 Tax=Methylobacterium fujisawaense TaxID=107400 RepID=A0ABR6D7A8_9HYPH|nr:branched-chain amino acid ABC transporter ATP-binding protein/permease [Methylobacterium fujisawaense]MBA9061976.1 ABC-type branched-subunit amino acid transport system ATPase component/ABC-type branched-subunit amino acid transport system permease subunit [Methylobacterium fujisawaense]